MKLNYNGLWKLLIDKDINKTELGKLTGISHTTIAKMTKGEPVSLKSLITICDKLDADIGDLVSIDKESIEV